MSPEGKPPTPKPTPTSESPFNKPLKPFYEEGVIVPVTAPNGEVLSGKALKKYNEYKLREEKRKENKERKETRKKALEMSDYRKMTVRQLSLAFLVGAIVSVPPAYLLGSGTKELLEWAIYEITGVKGKDVSGEIEKIQKVLSGVDEATKKGFAEKWRERISRLREGGMIQQSVPVLKIKKSFYEGTELLKDVLFWTTFASWWMSFFSLSSTLLFKYWQSKYLRSEQIVNNKEVGSIADEIKILKQRMTDAEKESKSEFEIQGQMVSVAEFQKFLKEYEELRKAHDELKAVFEEFTTNGKLSSETVGKLRGMQPGFRSMADEMVKEGIVVLEVDNGENDALVKEMIEELAKVFKNNEKSE